MPEIDKKTCCYCGEVISSGARRCPYCGSLIDVVVEEFGALKPESTEQLCDNSGSEPPFEQFAGTETGQGKTMAFNQASSDIETAVPVKNIQYGRPVIPCVRTDEAVRPMSNGLKVFLTIISTVIPGLGQLIGLITGIVLINSDRDPDKRSFGLALLVASIIFFLITCFSFLILVAALSVRSLT